MEKVKKKKIKWEGPRCPHFLITGEVKGRGLGAQKRNKREEERSGAHQPLCT